MMPTRGERNHNPLNLNFIPLGPRAWDGEVGIEPGEGARFGLYDTDFHGLRAGAKQMLKHWHAGADTIAKMAAIWAPDTDGNDSTQYGRAAANWCYTLPNAPYEFGDPKYLLLALIAFVRMENGRCLYGADVLDDAVRNALGLSNR